MIVYSRDLPTKGLVARAKVCELTPMNFGELLKFLGDEQLTSLREYVRNLECMIKHDPRVGDFSLLDADNLLFMFQVVTINKSLSIPITIRCPHCGKFHTKSINSNEIEFTDLSEDALEIFKVKLDGKYHSIKYVTISEFIEKVSKLPRYIESEKLNLVKLITMLDVPVSMAANLVLNAVQEDISTLNYLDNLWFDLISPIEIKCEIIQRGVLLRQLVCQQ